MSEPRIVIPASCAVMTRDPRNGRHAGRCWRQLVDGKVCPVHGDVGHVQAEYAVTGKLVDVRKIKKQGVE